MDARKLVAGHFKVWIGIVFVVMAGQVQAHRMSLEREAGTFTSSSALKIECALRQSV